MIGVLLVLLAFLAMSALMLPSEAKAHDNSEVACYVGASGCGGAASYVRGQPLRNTAKLLTSTVRQVLRHECRTALVGRSGGAYLRGRPLLNVARCVLGVNRRALRRSGEAWR